MMAFSVFGAVMTNETKWDRRGTNAIQALPWMEVRRDCCSMREGRFFCITREFKTPLKPAIQAESTIEF
jgi:hypothetical protein